MRTKAERNGAATNPRSETALETMALDALAVHLSEAARAMPERITYFDSDPRSRAQRAHMAVLRSLSAAIRRGDRLRRTVLKQLRSDGVDLSAMECDAAELAKYE